MLNHLSTRQFIVDEAIKKKIKPPCNNCSDRYLKCHSTCERYLEYRRALESEKKHYYDSREIESRLNKSKQLSIEKRVKNRNKTLYKYWLDYRPK